MADGNLSGLITTATGAVIALKVSQEVLKTLKTKKKKGAKNVWEI